MTEVKTARRTGRPPLTDRTALLGAAREIGFPGLTVGAVTAKVGVKYSTFYRHFPSLEALLAALVEDVLEEAKFPEPTGPWQDHVRGTCSVIFELFSRHPGLAAAIVRLPELPRRGIEAYQQMTDLMLEAGFSPADAAIGANAALETVVMPWVTATDRGAGLVRRRQQTTDTPVALDERIRDAIGETLDDPPVKWTTSKIDLLIAGLELRLAG
ncbi:TetR/AcrR family transcriptional regulator [Pseudonocardia endophytica]|uniref:TetR family transcriptional regulator n=1 Tax=Pseudonocardia endophytica TaxID=401976 RepID=A0A4R1HNK9_PSEEN|nr:TetR/AcrR family transcriptional regulator [Pseudonocardia endophytica]TCK21269.1 TetR family transcriptional regulator [Pseudonocardia endophytica]